MTSPCADVIEISLKFERTHDADIEKFSNSTEKKQQLKFLELSYKTLSDVCNNGQVHSCVSELLKNALIKKSNTSTSETDMTPLTTNATVHQRETVEQSLKEPKIAKRNSTLRTSMKSCHSMETVLEKNLNRFKEKSPDESKAKSVGQLNDENEEGEEYLENGESIELIFISDEFVNKLQRQEQEIIVLDERDGKRRESLTNSKKIVIITDEYKHKVLRNNSIVVTGEKKKMLKKQKKAKTINTNSNCFLPAEEPEEDEKLECKRLDSDK